MSTMCQLTSGSAGDIVVVDFAQMRFEPTLATTLRDNPNDYSIHHLDPTVDTEQLSGPASMAELAATHVVGMAGAGLDPVAIVGFCGGSVLSATLHEMAVALGLSPLRILVNPSHPSPASLHQNYLDYRADLGQNIDGLRDAPPGGGPSIGQMMAQLEDDLYAYVARRRMASDSENPFISMMLSRYRAWFTYVSLCIDTDPATGEAALTIPSWRPGDTIVSSLIHGAIDRHRVSRTGCGL
jgi:hypothetical protein